MITISTHVLDTALGIPAPAVPVRLERWTGEEWLGIADSVTNQDGRISELSSVAIAGGRYRLTAEIGKWFEGTGRTGLYPVAQIDLFLSNEGHYHLPFLISPCSWSTYRGS